MTSRTQYMTFLTSWVGATLAGLILADAFGFDVVSNIRGSIYLFGLIGILPASGAYIAVRKGRLLLDRWRVSHGEDVEQERAYEDDSGYLHINEVSGCEKQEDVSLSELVSDLKQVDDDLYQR
jgi:hypothetical protein